MLKEGTVAKLSIVPLTNLGTSYLGMEMTVASPNLSYVREPQDPCSPVPARYRYLPSINQSHLHNSLWKGDQEMHIQFWN